MKRKIITNVATAILMVVLAAALSLSAIAGENDDSLAVVAELIQKLRSGEITVGQVRDFLDEADGDEPTVSRDFASEIMGRNYFGPEEAVGYFGVSSLEGQLEPLSEVPFSEETLRECRDTHILVADLGLSILDIHDKIGSELSDEPWFCKESFAEEYGQVRWILIRKAPVDDSTWKDWTEQQFLLGEDEEVSSARMVVYSVIGHYLSMGEQLFDEDACVLTSSVTSNGNRISIGGAWGSEYLHGLYVAEQINVDIRGYYYVGLASVKKPES